MEFKNIVPGMTFEKEFIVEEGDTASHFGNDKVPVFSIPQIDFLGLKAQQSAQLLLSCRKAGKP